MTADNERIERLKRERHAALTALRDVRDSLTHDDAIAIAKEALRECGEPPEPTFDSEIAKFLTDRSLGAGLQRLAAGEAAIPQRLLDDLRCAGCERQDHEGYPGLCDGCLDALGDEAA